MLRALILVLGALAIPGATASAQGTITGTVRDADRRPLPGVTVVALAPPPSGPPRQAVSDASGRFVVSDLDPSRAYAVSFLLRGFEAERLTIVPADVGGALDVTLRAGPSFETVTPPFSLLPQLDLPGPRLAPQVPGRPCLHDTAETPAEAARRLDALRAMRLIATVVSSAAGRDRFARFTSWAALASSPAVESLRQGAGPAAELANRIAWGSAEPLPGWRLAYATTIAEVRYALTDERDPCGFTYRSTDPQVVPPTARVLPLT